MSACFKHLTSLTGRKYFSSLFPQTFQKWHLRSHCRAINALKEMTEGCGQEQTRWITTVIMSAALQVWYCLSGPASDSLGNAERSISYILHMEIFYSMSTNTVFSGWNRDISLKLLLLEYWFFLCVSVFSASYFHIYLVFLPPAILGYTALRLFSWLIVFALHWCLFQFAL